VSCSEREGIPRRVLIDLFLGFTLNHYNVVRYQRCDLRYRSDSLELRLFVDDDNYEDLVPGDVSKEIISQMIDAVNYIHSLGIAHGSISLDSFALVNRDRIVMRDFSVASLFATASALRLDDIALAIAINTNDWPEDWLNRILCPTEYDPGCQYDFGLTIDPTTSAERWLVQFTAARHNAVVLSNALALYARAGRHGKIEAIAAYVVVSKLLEAPALAVTMIDVARVTRFAFGIDELIQAELQVVTAAKLRLITI